MIWVIAYIVFCVAVLAFFKGQAKDDKGSHGGGTPERVAI